MAAHRQTDQDTGKPEPGTAATGRDRDGSQPGSGGRQESDRPMTDLGRRTGEDQAAINREDDPPA